tara:strand:+ start:194 stop:403 length:210 start_codon:yes stop_codon:yes gene_type:complete
MGTLSPKTECQIFKRKSCIQDLKQLVKYLTDRDINNKENLATVKSILSDKTIKTDAIKIRKIKQLFKNG